MQPSAAWLLRAAGGVRFAVAPHQMVGYEIGPRCQPVPLAQAHCQHLAFWRESLVPTFDLARLFTAGAEASRSALGILAYQSRAREPLDYLGVWLEAAPGKIVVTDEQACELPSTWCEAPLAELALACFSHSDTPVPVLNVGQLARKLS